MERACEERDGSLIYFRGIPSYDKLRSYKGWAEVERKMGVVGETS
jgi:hypothetical protein